MIFISYGFSGTKLDCRGTEKELVSFIREYFLFNLLRKNSENNVPVSLGEIQGP